jgi:hypothetical protein
LPRLVALEDRSALSTLTVLNNLDHGAGSLRATLAAARNGDTIAFASTLSGQTITLTSGELLVTQVGLTISGPGATRLTISGNGTSRVFEVHQPADHRNLPVVISGLTLTGGKAAQGGAVFDNASVLTLDGLAVVGNTTAGAPGTAGARGVANNPGGAGLGGGIYVSGDANGDLTVLTLTNSTIANNRAVGGPGVAGVNDGQVVHATGGRGGAGEGGGLFVTSGTVYLGNSTFAGNQAAGGAGGAGLANPAGQGWPGGAGGLGAGGAVLSTNLGHVTAVWLTVATNAASGGAGGAGGAGRAHGAAGAVGAGSGGGVYTYGAFATTDTIYALNLASTSGPDITGTVTSSGHNLVGNSSGSRGFLSTGHFDLVNDNPMLGQLGYNGGQTQTMPLNAGSPAIDYGVYYRGSGLPNLTADQRGAGYRRTAGKAPDIGAFEYQ